MAYRILPPNLTVLAGMTNELARKMRQIGPVTTTGLAHSNVEILHKRLEKKFPGEFSFAQIEKWKLEIVKGETNGD